MGNQNLENQTEKELISKYLEKLRQLLNSTIPNVPDHKQSECKLEIAESMVSTLVKEITEMVTMKDVLKVELSTKINDFIKLYKGAFSNEEAVLFKVSIMLQKGKAVEIESLLNAQYPILEVK